MQGFTKVIHKFIKLKKEATLNYVVPPYQPNSEEQLKKSDKNHGTTRVLNSKVQTNLTDDEKEIHKLYMCL